MVSIQSVECRDADIIHQQFRQLDPSDNSTENSRFLHSYLSKHAPLLIRHALSLFGFADMGPSLEAQDETLHEYEYSTRFNNTFVVKLYKDPGRPLLTFSKAYTQTASDERKDEIKALLRNYHPTSFVADYSIVDSLEETVSSFTFIHAFEWPRSPVPLFTLPDLTAVLHKTEAALLADNQDLADSLIRTVLEDEDEIQPATCSDDDDDDTIDPNDSDDSLKWHIAESVVQMESIMGRGYYSWGR